MHRHALPARHAVAAVLALAASAAVPAAEPPSAIDGADLRTLCPGVDTALQEALGSAWFKAEGPATVRVRMGLDGPRVTDVAIVQGPRFDDRLVRRAVRGLDCSGHAEGRRLVTFELRFVEPDGGAPAGTLAQRAP